MTKTLMIYILATLIAFSSVTTITMKPIDISAQTQPAAPTQSPLQTQQQQQQNINTTISHKSIMRSSYNTKCYFNFKLELCR